jgi:tetrahydrodipicolinate N-succinyltransferase
MAARREQISSFGAGVSITGVIRPLKANPTRN